MGGGGGGDATVEPPLPPPPAHVLTTLLDGVPAVAETVRTVRDAISCLNIAAAQAEEE